MIEVVAARIRGEGGYLLCRRPPEKRNGGLWEFPGGKIEPGESGKAALKRELKEELNIETDVGDALARVEHDYGDFTIALTLYDAAIRAGRLKLNEHTDARFVKAEELTSYALCPADRELIEKLRT